MTKGIKKPNPKSADGKVAAVHSEKKVKIAKKAKAAEKGDKKSNPSGAAAKAAKVKRVAKARNYFTVGEDLQILEAFKAGKSKVLSGIAKGLHANLPGHSAEAIRDRLKRYIKNLSAADEKEIQSHGKKNPKGYVHFKADKNNKNHKVIEKITALPPALHNRHFIRRPRVSKKKPANKSNKRLPPPDERLKWVVEKLQNKDPYYKLEFSVQLLADILNVLIQKEGVSAAEVERVLGGIHCDQNLAVILDNFKLKK